MKQRIILKREIETEKRVRGDVAYVGTENKMSPEGVLSIVAGTDSWLRASGTMQAKNVMVELIRILLIRGKGFP